MQEFIIYVVASSTLGAVRDYANSQVQQAPTFTLGSPALLRLRIFDDYNESNPYPIDRLSGCVSWQAVFDRDFAQGTTPVLVADNARIVAKSVSETINETEYEFTEIDIPIVDMNTQELVGLLGVAEEYYGLHLELVGFDAHGSEAFLLQVKNFTIRNRIYYSADPTTISPDYLTASQVRALIAAGVDLQYSANGTSWHDTQEDTDRYVRFRSASDASSAWSSAVSLPAGAPGPANSLSIGTVTTLPAGSPASARITGDAPNQTLDLSIPQGEPGSSSDLSNYYTKPQTDSLLSGRAASADLASEASARQSADAALDTRVSDLEQSGGGSAPDLTNYYTKAQSDALLAAKANAAHTHAQADVAGLVDALAAKANAAHTHDQADVAGLAAALAAKQDALPAGTTGLYLQKTASGVRWADVTATDYDPLYDRRVVSPVEITSIESTLRSLIEDMPHMCPKTIVVTHDCGDSDPAYPADKIDRATGLQLGHTYQLTLWGGEGNYSGYGHATPSGTPGPSGGYVTGTRLVLPSSFGAAAGTYYLTDGVWTRPASGTTPAYYIGNSGWTAWAFSGWYAGPNTDVATAYQADSDCIVDGPYYAVASYSWSPSADGDAVMADALATAVVQYGEDYTRPKTPADDGIEDNVIIGVVFWATYLDITPCVAGTCPLEARIAALEQSGGGSAPDLTNYYTKDQANALLAAKAAAADLTSEATARASADAALDTRVSALENPSGAGTALTVDYAFPGGQDGLRDNGWFVFDSSGTTQVASGLKGEAVTVAPGTYKLKLYCPWTTSGGPDYQYSGSFYEIGSVSSSPAGVLSDMQSGYDSQGAGGRSNVEYRLYTLVVGSDAITVTLSTTLGTCLVEGTMVSLVDGTRKPVEEITYSDELLCWDFDEGRLASARPATIKPVALRDTFFVNRFDDGSELRTNGQPGKGHEFFDLTQSRFDYNARIEGHEVYTLDGPKWLLESRLVWQERPVRVYHIVTARHFNLFANGVLTSVRLNNMYPIADMVYDKTAPSTPATAEQLATLPPAIVDAFRMAEQPAENYSYVKGLVAQLPKCREGENA